MRIIRYPRPARLIRGLALVALIAPVAAIAVPQAPPVKGAPVPAEGPPEEHVSLGRAVVGKLRIGARIKAGSGPVANVRAQLAVPVECDEQQVQIVDDEFSDGVSGDQRILPMGIARQLMIFAPRVEGGQTVRGLVTYEIKTFEVLPPTSTDKLTIPQRLDRELIPYVKKSPYIEVGDRKIREAVDEALEELAKKKAGKTAEEDVATAASVAKAEPASDSPRQAVVEAVAAATPALDSPFAGGATTKPLVEKDADQAGDQSVGASITDWQKIEAFYDYALARIKYVESEDKSAIKALEEGVGDCQAVSALFVAMCRTAKVPARTVWADGHQYAEFYLLDSAGVGHWYPIESAGTRSFGGQPTPRVILQKGDNFRVPERRGESLRYANDHASADAAVGSPPKVTLVREKAS